MTSSGDSSAGGDSGLDRLLDRTLLLGCSAAGAVTAEMVKVMAPQPLILALANPEPETRNHKP